VFQATDWQEHSLFVECPLSEFDYSTRVNL
jgi:hypothetical protein